MDTLIHSGGSTQAYYVGVKSEGTPCSKCQDIYDNLKSGGTSFRNGHSTATLQSRDGNNYVVGPIKISYGSYGVDDFYGNGISFVSWGYDKSGTGNNSYTSIPSGRDIYVKISSSKSLKELNNSSITFYQESYRLYQSAYWARIEPGASAGSNQPLLVYGVGNPKTGGESVSVKLDIPTGSITVNKKDASTGKSISGVQFQIEGPGVNMTKTTGSNGKAVFDGLEIDKTYHIYETSVPSPYVLWAQKNYNESTRKVDFGTATITLDKNNLDITKSFTNIELGKLTIKKTDTETKESLKGAGFKIYASVTTTKGEKKSGWLSGSASGPYSFSTSGGDTYFTNSSGELVLKNLWKGTYHIYETSAPSGYKLTGQPQYDASKGWVDFGSYTVSNSTNTSFSLENKKYGSLIIGGGGASKTDEDTKKTLSGAQFKVYADTKEGKGWLVGTERKYNKGKRLSYTYSSNFSSGTTYNQGQLIDDLEFGTYTIYEVKAPNGYHLSEQAKDSSYPNKSVGVYDSSLKAVKFPSVTLERTGSNQNVKYSLQNAKYGSLTVSKTDADKTNIKLRMGFKLKRLAKSTSEGTVAEGWVGGNTDGSYSYNNSYNNATIYYTDGGTKTMKYLEFGTYEIYEVVDAVDPSRKVDPNYDLTVQKGYDATNKWIKLGTFTLAENKTQKTFSSSYTNKKIISISGYVWEDVQNGKLNDTNSLYDNGEKRISGIPVRLIRKSDKKVIATATTDKNGAYKFEKKITAWEAENHYVEFNYNGKTYKKYIPVAFNSATASQIKTNGSRALEDEIKEKDTDNVAIASTYKGSSAEKTYGLSCDGNVYTKLYNNKNYTLEYINLGIKKIPDTDFRIEENIDYVKVTMNKYNYTYKYGKVVRKSSDVSYAPTVSWQSKTDIAAYTRPIYPADISYDANNPTNPGLSMEIRYRIDIVNTTEYNMKELYQEIALYMTQIDNVYDSKRYTLNDSHWKNISTSNTENTARMTDSYLKDIYGNGIAKGETNSKKDTPAYITFKINHESIMKILDNPKGQTRENYPTRTIATGYHKYKRDDYSWNNNIKKEQTHITDTDTRWDVAPYLAFQLSKNKRTISGTVFEDNITTDSKSKNEALGNGIKDNKENAVSGVKVELLNMKSDETVTPVNSTSLSTSYLYRVNEDTKKAIKSSAITKTDAKGNYSLVGVVPGKYYIKFTYGNGTYKITDLNGKEISNSFTTKIGSNTISPKDYKSTIVTSTVAKEALQKYAKNTTNKGLWYQKLEGQNYSVAVDNLDYRKANVNDTENPKDAIAGTARLDVSVENTGELTYNGEQTQGTSTVTNNSTGAISNTSYLYTGLNFGIIAQPIQSVTLDKFITNLKLVNAQNNVIFDGNPTKASMKGVSDLDKADVRKNRGSNMVRVELQEDEIYGSTLTVTYGIRVQNTSDVNYYEDKYYWYGDKTGAHEVTIEPKVVTDYLDPTLTYTGTDPNVKIVGKEKGKQKLEITGWGKLYTSKGKNTPNEKTINISASRILSAQDDDMIVNNQAVFFDKITNAIVTSFTTDNNTIIRTWAPNDPDTNENNKNTKVAKTTINKIKVDEDKNKGISPTPTATVTITPPTGEDRLTPVIYITIGVVALAILSGGVIIIKKKVV